MTTHIRPTEKIAMRAIFCFLDMLRPRSEATGSPSNAKSEMTLNMIGIATCQFAAALHLPCTEGGGFGYAK